MIRQACLPNFIFNNAVSQNLIFEGLSLLKQHIFKLLHFFVLLKEYPVLIQICIF